MRKSFSRKATLTSLAMTGVLFAMPVMTSAALTVTVDGVGGGAPNFATLSEAVTYVNANTSEPNIINITVDTMTDGTQIQVLVPMTINGDADGNSTPCDILVDTTTIGLTADVGGAGKNYIELNTAGSVLISDLKLHPNTGGDLAGRLIDAVGMYKPASGTGNYTLERIGASSSNSSNVYQEPASAADAYYATCAKRWYAFGNTRGVFNLTNAGGGGSYNAILTDCRTGAPRSHGLNIQNTSGTTTINGGTYSWSGQDNIRISGTGVTLQGTSANRVQTFGGNSSSSGEGIRVLAGAAVTKMEFVDSGDQIGGASAFAFYGGTVTLMKYCRAGGTGGSPLYFATDATVTAENLSVHRPAAGSVINFAGSHTGAVSLLDSVLGSGAAGNIVIAGTGTQSFNYCAIPTSGAETLAASPFSAAPTSNTNAISTSPAWSTTVFSKTSRENIEFLRPNNLAYTNASSLGTNLTGGAAGIFLPVELDSFSIN